MQKILYMELYTNTSTPVNSKTQFLNKQLLFLNYMIYFLLQFQYSQTPMN